jgi:hypothetical protein
LAACIIAAVDEPIGESAQLMLPVLRPGTVLAASWLPTLRWCIDAQVVFTIAHNVWSPNGPQMVPKWG